MFSMQMISSAPLPPLQASIHIGASSISMLILENHEDSEQDDCDFLEQSIPLARDIFKNGSVSRSTIERCVRILQGYLETLRELGATDETPIRAVTTNIIGEANNADVLSKRIQIACGLNVENLDEGEMTRLIYLKTRRRLRDTPSMMKRTTLVIHSGPGNTRALLFKNGRIADYTNYRLGVYRTIEAIDSSQYERGSETSHTKLIREHTRSQISQIQHDYESEKIEELVIIGYEVQHLAHELAKPGKSTSTSRALANISSAILNMTEEQRVKTYKLDYNTAQAIIPALEINLLISNALGVQTLRLPGSDYERGLLLDLHTSYSLTHGFQREVLRSAESLSRKFRVHRKHSSQVARLTESLFNATLELHKLGDHDALLLQCAAILHECGNFVSTRAHHKHSHYIISNSEIFGLGQRDINLIALVARYHRRSGPKPNHAGYRDLTSNDRMRVSKLAAILRIADALDRSHTSRIRDINISINKQKLILNLPTISDASVERIAMRTKANLFRDIYGLEVILQDGR
ncbi:MAG TPA: hypothetical protein DEP88_05115 [Verrucomicrobiales bacterium]|jgi:exopolyphosphatase/guanosine-5'-triphosphate,3'-diphosphate pyrophosphatase|nr:hypothetical protein [Verrucomicrobiales bacterium]HCI91370.1 hypothetical protein [Verrucomicrobiales bacterium]